MPWNRLSSMLLVLLALASSPFTASAQPEDWALCGQEGDVCRFSGGAELMLRFGANGHYAFRITRDDQQACTANAFGVDPAPDARKHCDVSVNWRRNDRYRGWQAAGTTQGEWTVCANEGDICRVPGNAVVRYGADGRYAERNTDRDLGCNNAMFGDPMEGAAKQCAFKRVAAAPPREASNKRRSLPWAPCAREGERCEFRGPAIVRYGVTERFFYEEGYDGMRCANESFGEDPAPGREKHCDILKMN